MQNVIVLKERRVKKWSKLLDKKIEEVRNEFSFITDEVIEEHVQTGKTSLENVVKTIWQLVERMDKLEVEITKLKLLILEASYRDRTSEEYKQKED